MTCPTCLRPIANADDQTTWENIGRGADPPDDWSDAEGDHLCWDKLFPGSYCEPPEWFATVTPAEVINLRAEVARLTPTWLDGTPPADTLVSREGAPDPVWTLTTDERAGYEGAEALYWHDMDGAVPWGTARWCPIVRPA